jgi:CDGSH-type Zn-finger protein
MQITVTANGPYLVEGQPALSRQTIEPNAEGESWSWRQDEVVPAPPAGAFRLCRCGGSANKPFCDGTHRRNGFDGTETADRGPYAAAAKIYPGPELVLSDVEPLCVHARFCMARGTVWRLIRHADQESVDLALRAAGHCPSGRLRTWRRPAAGDELEPAGEPAFEPSIGVVRDAITGISGPLWVRGGIAVVSADGTAYEVRNRVTLCRCGASANKPFCDGSHLSINFQDDRPADASQHPPTAT